MKWLLGLVIVLVGGAIGVSVYNLAGIFHIAGAIIFLASWVLAYFAIK